jgi:AGZA family xanthine/uracil permease-like MFS transporter
MPFTYSITAGIGAGFITYVVIKIARGNLRAVHPLMWIVAALFVVYFAIDPIGNLAARTEPAAPARSRHLSTE